MQLVSPAKTLRLLHALLIAALLPSAIVAQQTQSGQDLDPTDTSQRTQIPQGQPSTQRGITLQNDNSNGDNQQNQYPDQYQNQYPNQYSNQYPNQQTQRGYPQGQNGQNINGLQTEANRNQALQQPYRPTEFQRLVRDTLGRALPIYGANLFQNTPSTFAPVDRVPVTPDYTIGPGDELLIQTWGQVTSNGHYTVDRTGSIYIPQVGTIHVAGLQFAQVQGFVKAQMERVFRNFDLNVNMGQLRSIQIFVVGQARRPGSYTVSSLSTLVNALFVTGGPTPQGSLRHIELKRADKVVVEFDLYDLLLHGDKSKDVPLLPGDVIYIPSAGPQVAVAGSVNTPAIYELRGGGSGGDSSKGNTVGEAVELAGGLTTVAMTKNLRIERISGSALRSVVEFGWTDEGKATLLQGGDILEFPTISDQFADAVTLRGNVASPGRYTWHPGMRIRDLIPTRESLITRDYWQQRAKLGESTLNYIPLPVPQDVNRNAQRTRNGRGTEDDTQQMQYDGTSQSYLNGAAQNDIAAPTTSGGNLPLIDGTTSRALSAGSNASDRSSSTEQGNGSSGRTEVGAASTLFPPKTYVMSSGPDINWAYAVIDRQDKKDLTTSLIPFNLGAVVLNADETQNYELQPEDVVTIFSKADIRVPQAQQTRYVKLDGEFVASGIYTVRPGETLRELVARAGGLTGDAYLYGSDFTRESTRRSQQQRLNDYANELERQASGSVVKAASNSVSIQDNAAAVASQQQSQQLVARLRQVQATGRIVLNLPVDSQGVAALPDLPLEDGDSFLVPRVPSTVAVVGAVYNANAFLYSPGQRVGGYLKRAGGSNRDADKGREFVVRADGSVVSRQYSSSLRGGNFDGVRLYPGDTVVVPQNINKGSVLRTVVDIATIVGQFGLAAAAINLVK